MFHSFFKLAWRNMVKSKVYSTINLVGLAIGIASFLVVVSFIKYEMGFDRFHTNNIYRLGEIKTFENNAPEKIARTMFPMGPTLQSDFAEVVDFTRIAASERLPLRRSGQPGIMATAIMADVSFFNIF